MEWLSITQQDPPIGQRVLFYIPDTVEIKIGTAESYPEWDQPDEGPSYYIVLDGYGITNYPVSHWMLLPTAPSTFRQ